jgi:hypothetical protein
MNSVPTADEQQAAFDRLMKLRYWRLTSSESEEYIATQRLGFESAEHMYQQLKKWEWPDWAVYPASLKQRKARRGSGDGRHLPPARGAIELFAPVVARLQDLFSSLTALDEAYKDERFEAVERYPGAAITENDEATHDSNVVLPLGATQSPSRISTELIAAYVIAEEPIEPLVEALHDKPDELDRAKLDKKVEHLRLLAGHVAKLVRGGKVRPGHNTEELSSRDQEAVRYYSNKLRAGVPEEEIQRTLVKWGFKRSDMLRIKNLGQNFLYR